VRAARVWARRIVVSIVVLLQVFFVVHAYGADHKLFGYQMFSEASTWRADIVRVTSDGRRVPIEEPWAGYAWDGLVGGRGLWQPGVRHHADHGVDEQLAYLRGALDWVAANTPNDTETERLEAVVTYWHNADPPRTVLYASQHRMRP
jgi:hypothetical protein